MAVFSKDLGIDLGTMFTRLADSTQVLLEEPTIVAIEVFDQKMVAVGKEALDMYGRVPESIEVARPLKNGVIADYEITETLLQYLLQRVSGSMRIFRPRVMISVPFGVTSVEWKIQTDAFSIESIRSMRLGEPGRRQNRLRSPSRSKYSKVKRNH